MVYIGEIGASPAPWHVRQSRIFRSLNNISKGERVLESNMTDTICLGSKRRLNNENPRIRIEKKNGRISIFSVSTKVFICYAIIRLMIKHCICMIRKGNLLYGN